MQYMSDENFDRSWFTKRAPRGRIKCEVQDPPPSTIPAQLRIAMFKAATGETGQSMIPVGPIGNQMADTYDRLGLPYPFFRLGPIA